MSNALDSEQFQRSSSSRTALSTPFSCMLEGTAAEPNGSYIPLISSPDKTISATRFIIVGQNNRLELRLREDSNLGPNLSYIHLYYTLVIYLVWLEIVCGNCFADVTNSDLAD
jgi:hypothetical protein